MSQVLRGAAITMDGLHERAAQTLPRLLSWLHRSAGAGAQVVLFPECALGHYFDDPISITGPEVGAVAQVARKHKLFVGLGFGERAGEQRYSSYALIGPQGIIGVHRKTRWQTGNCPIDLGTEVKAHEFAGIRVGAMICAEARFLDVAQLLKGTGVDLLIVPAASGADPEATSDSDKEEFVELLQAPAREIGAPAIGVGATGTISYREESEEHVVRLRGGCMVVDWKGAIQYWRPSTQPELHRLDLHLPAGQVTMVR